VLFHKRPSEVEVLNDLDGEIVNFFRVCQQHPDELIRYLKNMLVSRAWFELLKVTNPASLTDIQRAARHLYLLKNCYGSMVVKQNYHLHVVQPPGFNLDTLPESIAETYKRLARVQIECLPYEKVLKHFDRPETLFYLDPPYFGRNVKGGVKPDQWGGVKVDQSAAGKLLDMRGVWRLERSGRRHTPRSGLRRGGWVAGAAVRGWRDRVYACSA
jgi:site-specific DNA-adenine methylase